MAKSLTSAPASGILGTTPAIFNTELPRWAYLALALACAGMGLWSSVVTLQFFEHGAAALENDPALQALAVGAAVLFVFGEMSACVLAALMTGSQFKARRWILYGLAVVILGIEIFTISSVQMASVAGASMTQTSVSDSVADLQKQIATVEANAANYTATSNSLRAADQLKKATAYADKATAEQAKTTELYARLDASRKAKRPTLSGLLGEKTAMYYAIARGVLVVLSGIVFFGTAGVLLHAARGGALSTDQQILELLHQIRTGSAPVAMQVQAAPVAPAPAAPVLRRI